MAAKKKSPKKRTPKKRAAKKPSRLVDIFRFESEPEEVEVGDSAPLGAADTSDNERKPARDHTPPPSLEQDTTPPAPPPSAKPPPPPPVAKSAPELDRREQRIQVLKANREILRRRLAGEPEDRTIIHLELKQWTNNRVMRKVRESMKREKAPMSRLDEFIAVEIPIK